MKNLTLANQQERVYKFLFNEINMTHKYFTSGVISGKEFDDKVTPILEMIKLIGDE
tara:strand:- start:333 stop:500 length:168 start_codon:yes stop_codon:yes gene_type:complete